MRLQTIEYDGSEWVTKALMTMTGIIRWRIVFFGTFFFLVQYSVSKHIIFPLEWFYFCSLKILFAIYSLKFSHSFILYVCTCGEISCTTFNIQYSFKAKHKHFRHSQCKIQKIWSKIFYLFINVCENYK